MALTPYHVLIVFCLGVAVQSAFFLRTAGQALGALAIAAVVVTAACFMSEPDERAFAVPVTSVFFYAIAFAAAFGRRIVKDVTPAAVLHLLMLAYFALHLCSRAAGVALPASVIIGGLVPGVLTALLLLFGLNRYRSVRILSYIVFILSFLVVILCQWSIQDFKELFERSGFSFDLFLYAFLAGGVFLLFWGNLVQLVLLLPPLERASTRIIWDKIVGPLTYHKEQRELLSRRMGSTAMDAVGWFLLALQFTFLFANEKLGFMNPATAQNACVLAVYLGVIPWEVHRRKGSEPPPAPASPPPGP